MDMQNKLVQSLLVGVMTVIVGTLVCKVAENHLRVNLPEACNEWNKNYVLETSLFTTGVLMHFLPELVEIVKDRLA